MSVFLDARMSLGPFAYDARFEADGEIVVLFGHSGAGKSVSLQLIAGLMKPSTGRIEIDGATVTDTESGHFLPPQQRSVGYVVQSLALFPHMTVEANIRFAMPPGIDQQARLAELLSLLELQGFEDRKPRTLSGGQQQRVALARALARNASVLLLDEPFSALDEFLREGMRRELLRLRAELGLTIIFVTHDLREAHLLADRIAVFDEGHVLQFGTRDEIFRRPRSRRVAQLTGVENLLSGRLVGGAGNELRIECDGMQFDVATPADVTFADQSEVDICIRAERVNLRRHDATEGIANTYRARVVREFAYGNTHTLELEPLGPGPALRVELAARPYEVLGVAAQKVWTVELPADDLHVMQTE